MIKTSFKLSLLLVTLFLFTSLAKAESVDFQQWKQQVLSEIDTNSDSFSYHDFSQNTRDLMKQRSKEAEGFFGSHADDPIPLYILGWLGSVRQSFYHYDLQKVGKRYNRYAPENQALIKEYQSYYQKAMELDDNPDAPEHLTAMMLARIGTDSVGDPAIKVRALEKAAALARAGKNDSDSEMFEWNTYEARLGIYIDAKDYDNALKTVNAMIDRFGNNEEMEGYKRHVEDVITKQQQTATQDNYTQADTYSVPEPVAEEPTKTVKQMVASEPTQAAKPTKVVKAVKSQPHPHRIIPCCGGCLAAALACSG